jgi:hypothetical protein
MGWVTIDGRHVFVEETGTVKNLNGDKVHVTIQDIDKETDKAIHAKVQIHIPVDRYGTNEPEPAKYMWIPKSVRNNSGWILEHIDRA